jgi:hypothetical protein
MPVPRVLPDVETSHTFNQYYGAEFYLPVGVVMAWEVAMVAAAAPPPPWQPPLGSPHS